MASVEVRTFRVWVCDHCEELLMPVLSTTGIAAGINHRCEDGHMQDHFDHVVGLTRSIIVPPFHMQRLPADG